MSLTTKARLTIWYSIVVSIILIIFATSVYFYMRKQLYDSIDDKLLSIAQITYDSSLYFSPSNNIPAALQSFLKGYKIKQSGSVIRILDVTGKDIDINDIPVINESLKKAFNGYMVFENVFLKDKNFSLRLLTYPVIVDGYVISIIQVGTSLESLFDSLKKLIFVMLILLPIGIIISIFAGYFLAERALTPIKLITKKAKRISAENLDEKISGDFPDDEIGELAKTFDKMMERLKDSFDELRQFSADVSHELRTPLTILKGEIELALKSKRDPEYYEKTLKSALEEVDRLKRLVEDLLFLSKADAGKITYRLGKVDILEVVLSVINVLSFLIKQKRIKLNIDGEPEIFVKGDENLLKQLIYNLVHNAIKYNKEEGEIYIGIREEKDYVKIIIKDTGFGISEEHLNKIFNRFYRIDKSRTRLEGGLGLGLNIVKKIVDLHNGNIHVESNVNKGTKFEIILPKYK